jgi:hypothetical protein
MLEWLHEALSIFAKKCTGDWSAPMNRFLGAALPHTFLEQTCLLVSLPAKEESEW